MRKYFIYIAIFISLSQTLYAEQPEADKYETLKKDGVVITYSPSVKTEYAESICILTSEARKIYADEYLFNMPDTVYVFIEKNDGPVRLYTDGISKIFLQIKYNLNLAPPLVSGQFNIYGFCHELGHIAMYRKVPPKGLPEGVAEGWAYYTGSIVVDEIYKKLGRDLWPQKYDYAEVEGTSRLKKHIADPERMKEPVIGAAAAFYAVHEKYGVSAVMKAMNEALIGCPSGSELMPRFVDKLNEVTGDANAGSLIPAEFLVPTATDQSRNPESK